MVDVNVETGEKEIKKRKKWVKPGIIIGVIVFIVLLIAIRIHNKSSEKNVVEEERVQPVEVVSVMARSFGSEVRMAGTVTAFTETSLSPKVMGRVSAIHADVGKRVRQGETLLVVEQNDYDIAIKQAESSLAVAQANTPHVTTAYQNAQLNYQRTEELYNMGAVSQSQLEAAKGQLASAQSALDANNAQIAQSKVMLDKARSDYNNTILTSPIAGIVAKRSVNVGEIVSQQTPAFTVIQDDPLLVKVDLTENVVSKVSVGQEVDVYSKANSKTYQGKVKSVAPQADAATKAYKVEIRLDGVSQELKPGMVVDVIFITEWVENTLVVPTYVLLDQDDGYAVFVFEEGIVKKRKVTIGMMGQGYTEIKDGLEQGEKVIGRGNYLLVDGMKVTVESTRRDETITSGGDS